MHANKPEKLLMLRPKKNSYKEFDNEKKFLRLKNSPPAPHPHNFSNGLPLRADNPTHPLLNPLVFPWFAQGPIPGES